MSDPLHRPPLRKALALDTSTDRLSVAVGDGVRVLAAHEGVGGAQASSTLIPTIQRLLTEVGWTLPELDAIAFGCGPGSFTGLRTACAVVQGLAVAARPDGIPVVPVPTLLAVAEEARWQMAQQPQPAAPPPRVLATLDARMDELYVAEVHLTPQGLHMPHHPWLSAPEALSWAHAGPLSDTTAPRPWLAGNALEVYGHRFPAAWQNALRVAAWPTAAALLRLLPSLWAQGGAMPAVAAQPLYVRDKVAQTTEERERAKAVQAAATGARS